MYMKSVEYKYDPRTSPESLELYVPEEISWAADDFRPSLTSQLRAAAEAGCVIAEELDELNDGDWKIALLLDKVGAKRKPETRAALLNPMSGIIQAVASADSWSRDRQLYISFRGTNQGLDKGSGMYAQMLWPEASDEDVTELATTSMRTVANVLRYGADLDSIKQYRTQLLEDFVVAEFSKEDGVRLQTDPLSQAHMSVDNSFSSEQDTPYLRLETNKELTPEQQLICLAGAIAIAHADELLATS